MKTLTNIPVKFDRRTLLSKLHLDPNGQDASDFLRLLDRAGQIARPKALFRVCYVRARTEDTVAIDDVIFTSRALRVNLDKVERVFPFVATCGTEFDGLSEPGNDLLEQFWLEEIKTSALGTARAALFAHLEKSYSLAKITGMSPGSGDRDVWPIEQQRPLFSLLGDTGEAIGVRLTESCLMIPNKSVSGIAFPAKVTFETCRLCHRQNCPGRMAPFDSNLFRKINENAGSSGQ